ncbi:MAG: transcriptional regulator, partial [Rhodococcus sp. (in: high G+C Gram-positive bacteria)]
KLAKLILDLNSQSAEFKTLWADHNVVHHRRGKVLLDHPSIGKLELDYERLDSTYDPDLTMFIHLVENGSSTARRIAELVDTTDRRTDS